MISVVCFDLGGVLVKLSASWSDAAERARVVVRDRAWLDSESLRTSRWQIVQDYQNGALSCQQYYGALSQLMTDFTPEDVARVHAAWILDHYPGAEALVSDLNRTPGVRTACLSNTNHSHWLELTAQDGRYPAITKLRHQFASHLLGLSKPDARIYDEAAKQLGVEPDEILFFDDLVENIEAAKARGWRAEQIEPKGDTIAQMRKHLASHGVDVVTGQQQC
ncbi:MAG TPA: HAD family phosphatase [Polyangiaceae bacterium]|nr:HAD family phosphatase [Polyangiaceae bacterium]